MKIVVTGANGLVGSRVCTQLSAAGHSVLGIGRGERRVAGPWEWATVELSQMDEVHSTLTSWAPTAIIHTASMTEVDACEKSPESAWQANVEAARHIATAARNLEAHVVHVSTDYVFDGDNGPYSEDSVPNPKGVYALTKLMGEQAVRIFASSWAIARTAVVYGWPAAGRPNFGSWLVGALEKGQKVPLFEDQFVSPTLADSLAEMLTELALSKQSGIWNTCGAQTHSRFEFGQALCREFGLDSSLLVPTKMAELKLASPRPYRSALKVEKARHTLAAKPLSTAESLARFHQAYRLSKQ